MLWSYQQRDLKGRVAYNSYREGVARGLYNAAKANREAEEQAAAETYKKTMADRLVKEEENAQRLLARLGDPAPVPRDPITVKDEELPVKLEPMDGVKVEEVEDEDILNARRAEPESGPFTPPKVEDDDNIRGSDFGDEDVAPDFDGSDSDVDAEPARPLTLNQAAPDTESVKKEEEQDDDHTWGSSLQLVQFRKNAEAIADDFIKSEGLKLRKGRKRKANKRDRDAYNKGKEDSKKIDVKRRRLEEAPIVIKDEDD